MIEILNSKRRPLAYGLVIGLGFLLLSTVREEFSNIYYFLYAIVLYLVVLLELLITSHHYHRKFKTKDATIVQFESHRWVQYLHHWILPSLLFWSLALFEYFYNTKPIYFLVVILSSILFGILFENIYSYYKHQLSLTKTTNYIYDLLSVVILFLLTSVILNFSQSQSLRLEIEIVLLAFEFLVLGYLLVLRHIHLVFFLILLAFLVVGFGGFMYLLIRLGVSNQNIAFFGALYFQSFAFYTSHYIDKSLNKSTVSEYLITLMLIFALIYLYGA